jgi:hypothetical protein
MSSSRIFIMHSSEMSNVKSVSGVMMKSGKK